MWLWWNRWIIENIDHYVFLVVLMNHCGGTTARKFDVVNPTWENSPPILDNSKNFAQIFFGCLLLYWVYAVYHIREELNHHSEVFVWFMKGKKRQGPRRLVEPIWMNCSRRSFLLGMRPSWRFPIDLGYFQVFQAFNHFCIDFFLVTWGSTILRN